jgi:hypothetical protein
LAEGLRAERTFGPHRSQGSEDWAAALSPQVIDHNKIIVGEADEPGAAVEGFRRQLAAFGPADAEESGLLVQELIGEGSHSLSPAGIECAVISGPL